MCAWNISIYLGFFFPHFYLNRIFFFLWEIIKRKVILFTLDVPLNKTRSHRTWSNLKTKLKNSLKEIQWLQTSIIQSKKFIRAVWWLTQSVKSLPSFQWTLGWLVDSVFAAIFHIPFIAAIFHIPIISIIII